MSKRSKVAMAIALAAPLAIATAGNTSAAPVLSGALKASSAVTDVHFYGYCTYGYYPAHKYRYTYWYPRCRGRSGYYYYYR